MVSAKVSPRAVFKIILIVAVWVVPIAKSRRLSNENGILDRSIRSSMRGESSSSERKMPHHYKQICGISGSRSVRSLTSPYILNGSCTPYGTYPWTAQIQAKDSDGYSHHCGGTIITEDIIMSAAHCFDSKNHETLRIVVGQGVLDAVEDEEMVFEIESVVMHPEYNNPPRSTNNDIALLKIHRKGDGIGIIFSDFVAPACLPQPDTPQKTGTECTISGWGKFDTNLAIADNACLRSATVPILDEEKCGSWYKQNDIQFTSGMMCAGFENGGIDACTGDSGGPLACSSNGRYHITGVVSKGLGCGQAKQPGIYTKVKNYLDWIEETIQTML